MVSLVERTTHAARQRLSTVLAVPAPNRVDDALLRFSRRWPAGDLAPVPSGSDLRPVPGDYGPPLVGHLLDYIRFGNDLLRDRYERYGPVSWMGAFGTRVVTVAGPEATQSVLTNKDKVYSQDGWTFLIDQFFRRGLMLLDFDEHRTHRRIMQDAFTRDRLTAYVRQLAPTVRGSVAEWNSSKPVRLYWLLKDLTLDVANDVFMGGRGGGADHQRINQAFVATVRAASSMVRYPLPGTRWRAGVRGRQVLEDYFARHLPATRAGNGGDLFSALCQATTPEGERFSDDDVINHMIFLMMAAHDTTTITTTAAAYYLAKHPEWQDKARQESLALGEEGVDIDVLERLGTLDLIIKETLRLLAPVPMLMRRTVADTELLGHYLPSGTLVAVAPGVNHFVPECWTDPDAFDPERFAPHRREDSGHRFAWLPFGGGVHKCIGLHFGTLEVKAILHEMLRTYTWSVPERYQARWDNTSLPVPADGMPVRLARR
ncbi:cytochrome P450 [Saccharomonospora marina XMU15]|uniref:Cytochrome P450 n=1 Tax=Saccharomonospora marina XMU15 TaxID=882083 RepID=H5XBU5_9PSEU|nr:cytochrome P450 [Saccharomonospora marina]EHR52732.1 cytochrome P450 [Saccharomonospora marina XMU15]